MRRVGGGWEIVGNKREDLKVNAGDELDFITWRGERGATIPLFDYGPSIDDLRRRSQAGTGLAAPIQPRWTRTEAPLSIAAE